MYGATVNAKNLILQPAPSGGWEAVTRVALPQGEEYEQAGLIVHAGDRNYAKAVLIDIPNQGWRVEFGQTIDAQPVFDEALDRSGALPANASDGIYLKLTSDGSWLTAAWSMDGQTWTPLGRSRSMSTLAGAKVGLAAFNGSGQSAAFDNFGLDEVDVEPPCQEPGTPAPGYELLFDGTQASLDDWRMAGPGGFSLQQDCSILSFGGLGLLWHPQTFDAYSLKLDWKMAGDDNAGVFVGFPDPGNDPFNAVNQGHEIQIDATDDPSHTTGSIYGFQAADAAARDAALKPPGQWNAYEIVVQGDRIQVFLNGTKINDYVDTDPARMNAPSHIGLQNHGTGDDVYFRGVQIKEIDGPGTAPALDITAPANGAVVDGGSVTVSGTTDGTRVEVRAGATTREVTPSGGAFSASVPLALGSNTVTVTAYSADDVPTAKTVTVISRAFGTHVGGLTDPAGDDNGPGTYVYPTNGAFNDGAFDLEAMDVYEAGDQVRFVTRIAGDVRNPFGGDQISVQRVNVYLGGGAGDRVAALPGTNMDTASPWSAAVVVDGRFDTAGVYGPDGTKRSGGTLTAIPQSKEIVITVPRSALGDLDLGTARYGTAMLSNGESGEGVGFVRPVYARSYWENPPAGMPWIKEYRFGGGAGEWENTADKDTDVRDPNALDVIVGEGQTQAGVMAWQGGTRAHVPMLALASSGAPRVEAFADPSEGTAPLEVNFTASALDPDGGRIVEYRWTFPDGAALGQSVTHTFTEAGTHHVTLKVTDDQGESTTRELTVTVGERPNTAPEIVQAIVDRDAGPAPLETRFEATARDADGDALSYRWEFGDGGAAIGKEADHTYLTAGSYEAKVTVSDGNGGTDSATIEITVTDPPANRPPTVEAAVDRPAGTAPLDVLFTAQGADPDGDELTYSWDFGDGSAPVAARRARHVYTANGTYTATVTASDADGATATATVQVVVGNPAGNQPPTVEAAADRTTGTGPLKVNFSAAGFDPEGDPFTYVWDFGDGHQAASQRVTHTYPSAGTYVAKVTVRDAQGRTGEATVTITVTARRQAAGSPSPVAKTVLRSVGSRSLAAFRARGLKVAATCGSDAPRRATVRTTKAAARKLGLPSRSLGRATVRCAAGKALTLRLKPSRAARKALRTAKPAALRVTVALVLRDGGRIERSLRLK
jgi:PKD repeat protein